MTFASEHFFSIPPPPPPQMSPLPLGPLSFSGVEVLTSDFSPASLDRANCFSSRQYPFSMESYNQSDFTMWIFHFLANSYFGPEQENFKNNFKNSTEKRVYKDKKCFYDGNLAIAFVVPTRFYSFLSLFKIEKKKIEINKSSTILTLKISYTNN